MAIDYSNFIIHFVLMNQLSKQIDYSKRNPLGIKYKLPFTYLYEVKP